MKHSLENTAGATIGAGLVNPSEAHEFFPRFSEVCVARSFVFFAVFCTSLFARFILVIVLCVLLKSS
jgi:hypothetical protein